MSSVETAVQTGLFESLDSLLFDGEDSQANPSINVRITTLCSGSSGNAQLVEFGDTCILVDAGIGKAPLIAALKELGRVPGDLSAIFITHEHRDHTSGVTWLATRQGIPIYATQGTWEGDQKGPLGNISGRSTVKAHVIHHGVKFSVGDVLITPFATSHDASEPCGYRMHAYGRTVAVATDLGYVSDCVKRHLMNCDLIVLEANHDVEMLKQGGYPWFLKRRILGDQGHLSNLAAGQALANILQSKTKAVVLAHLSADNNTRELAYDTVAGALQKRNISVDSDVCLHVANRHGLTGPIAI